MNTEQNTEVEGKKAKKAKKEKQPKEPKVKEPKPELVSFRAVAPAEVLNSEGLLTTIDLPTFYPNLHQRLRGSDFAEEVLWVRYRANRMRNQANEMIATADQLDREAANLTNFGGDSKKRAQIKKLQKMLEGIDALKAALASDGVDVDSLLPN